MEFEVAREFTGIMLKHYRETGYKFLRKENYAEGIAILTPLFEDISDDAEGCYTIPIDDEQCDEMARGVNEQEFYVL